MLLKFETTRRVEGVKERVLIGADNPVARGDVKREDKRREKETWKEVRETEREKEKERRQSDRNKTWKNKTGRTTTLMRATGWPTQRSPFPGSSCSLVGEDNFCSVAGPLRRRRTLVTVSSRAYLHFVYLVSTNDPPSFWLRCLFLSVRSLCIFI